MSSLLELVSRVRAWRLWRALCRPRTASPTWLLPEVGPSRPILREVTSYGVRVYSLCGTCGTPLQTSATLCDACARSRTTRSRSG